LASSEDLITLEGHYSDIVYLGISTGFIDRGGINPCLLIMNQVLENQDNAFLFFFENYISLDKSFMNQSIGQNLLSPVPKLMVLHRDEANKIMAQTLKTLNNTILLYRPYTGKKFHHKLVIQYPTQGEFLILTGSFNLSTNAIKNNSETIIGIRSFDLADEYLATLFLNSGLGEQPSVWEVLREWKEHIGIHDTRLYQVAERLLKKCQNNMNRYDDVLERIEQHIVHTIPTNDTTLAIEKQFAEVRKIFKEEASSEILQTLENLIDYIFNESTIIPLYAKNLEETLTIIRNRYKEKKYINEVPHLEKSPSQEITNNWLKAIKTWIKNFPQEFQNAENIASLKREHIDFYNALKDLKNCPIKLEQWADLEVQLMKFLSTKEDEKTKEKEKH
ncbi:MAG TPA: hypothetical protein VNJ29_00545, partial [Candidatus Nitrosotenuis sp.]|nr:hypothetical protein [Candidatus Nitrosotenuis sp.]